LLPQEQSLEKGIFVREEVHFLLQGEFLILQLLAQALLLSLLPPGLSLEFLHELFLLLLELVNYGVQCFTLTVRLLGASLAAADFQLEMSDFFDQFLLPALHFGNLLLLFLKGFLPFRESKAFSFEGFLHL
jgi:hypothetical protein